ncbi:unnamed protein product, partial [Anisakis simplex]|uniref:Mediator of RNA polymerase II transcription subunit 4 n=1 Tax=Anisakis simplex TaxID=6269 RepID=A0A0M3KJE0_ANISI
MSLQMIAFLLEQDRTCESLASLSEAFRRKQQQLKLLLSKAVHQAEAKKVNSEHVIRFANQISKSYSVAAPLFWRLGDASRPFPTEVELRVSSLAAPRVNAPTTTTAALSLLRQPSA